MEKIFEILDNDKTQVIIAVVAIYTVTAIWPKPETQRLAELAYSGLFGFATGQALSRKEVNQ